MGFLISLTTYLSLCSAAVSAAPSAQLDKRSCREVTNSAVYTTRACRQLPDSPCNPGQTAGRTLGYTQDNISNTQVRCTIRYGCCTR
nr:uncharacterized protein CTRU02_02134 [Colletotrichum truncatum]KAF6799263.1 hypothetical protein CTRU02_02134 [Colletotrichum truncatum]